MDCCDYLQSDRLLEAGFVHAFFTRRGGVSRGPFESLNLSPDVGDDSEHVRENLRRAAAALRVESERLYVTRQVHGRDVIVLDGSETAARVATRSADANVSSTADLACAVRTADCVPILLGDPETGRVAAVHAGWRGVEQNIAGASVERLSELGSRPAALIAALGPHISLAAFEVGEDVAAALEKAPGGHGAVLRRPGHRPHVDLARIVRAQLVKAGLPDSQIDELRACTFSDAGSFFSHRRDGAASGRMLSAIVPRAPAPPRGRVDAPVRSARAES